MGRELLPLSEVRLFGLIKTEDIKKLGMVLKGAATVLKTLYETSHHRQKTQLPLNRAVSHSQHQVCSTCAKLPVRKKAEHVPQP